LHVISPSFLWLGLSVSWPYALAYRREGCFRFELSSYAATPKKKEKTSLGHLPAINPAAQDEPEKKHGPLA
jgi:hypothetical protein